MVCARPSASAELRTACGRRDPRPRGRGARRGARSASAHARPAAARSRRPRRDSPAALQALSVSSMCCAYGSQSVARRSCPPGASRDAASATNAGCSRRRLWWRFLGHGSGNRIRISCTLSGGELRVEHLHRVVADDAHVAQLLRLECQQHPPDAGAMHLDAEEVALRVRGRKPQQVVPVAEADLDRAGGRARVQRAQLERLRAELEPVLGPQLDERALLRRRDAPGTRHEGAHRTWMFDFGHKVRRAPQRSVAFDSNGSARLCAAGRGAPAASRAISRAVAPREKDRCRRKFWCSD